MALQHARHENGKPNNQKNQKKKNTEYIEKLKNETKLQAE